MKTKHYFTVIPIAVFALCLSACANFGALIMPQSAPSEAAVVAKSTAAAPSPSSGDSGGAQETESDAKGAESCANPQLDLAETAFGYWLTPKMIPTSLRSSFYKFDVIDNQFDPCAKLSWVTLDGKSGVMDQGSLSEDISSQTVMFFSKDKFLTDAPFLYAKEVNDVTVQGDKITIKYTPQKADEEWKAEYKLEGKRMVLSSPQRQGDTSAKFDFTKNYPPTDSISLMPYGNANHQVNIEDYSGTQLAEVAMGDGTVLCTFIRESQVTCENRRESTWPVQAPTALPGDSKAGPNGTTNHASIDFGMPYDFYTTYMPSGNIKAQATIPNDTVATVGRILLDTRGDTLKVSNNKYTVTLGDGVASAESKPLFQFDTSRYPDASSLRKWDSA